MTRFTVVWTNEASDDLARIWMASTNRAAVSRAARTIDVQLAENPGHKGAPLAEGLRKLICPPLAAIYTVRELDCMADVAAIAVLPGSGAAAPDELP